MVECNKCAKRIGFGESNPFINEQDEHIVLCTGCYFLLFENEKKKLVYIGKPKPPRGKYKPTGLVFGLLGSVPYSSGYNSGEHWMLNRRKNKTEYTQKQIDEKSIDMFNAHWDFLTTEAKQELLKEIEKKK